MERLSVAELVAIQNVRAMLCRKALRFAADGVGPEGADAFAAYAEAAEALRRVEELPPRLALRRRSA